MLIVLALALVSRKKKEASVVKGSEFFFIHGEISYLQNTDSAPPSAS
ncbi:MAG: hypothetical protein ACLRP3_05030 [Escherichia sp.]